MRYILVLIFALSFTPAFAGTVEKTGDYTVKITTTEIRAENGGQHTSVSEQCYTLKQIDERVSAAEVALASWEVAKENVESEIAKQEALITEWEGYKAQAEALGVIVELTSTTIEETSGDN